MISPQALALAQELVRMNTVSANSNLELIHFVRDYLAGFGIESVLTYDETGQKANLFIVADGRHFDPGGIAQFSNSEHVLSLHL